MRAGHFVLRLVKLEGPLVADLVQHLAAAYIHLVGERNLEFLVTLLRVVTVTAAVSLALLEYFKKLLKAQVY